MQYFSRHLPRPCPGFHRGLISVVASARLGVNTLPETSARACFGAQICRGTCPGIARISPRPDFGCRSGAAGRKFIARNFSAALLRCMNLSRQHPWRCPGFHRGLASVHRFVAAPARALPGFSPRLNFGCRSGAAGLKYIARNVIAALLRCMNFSRHLTGRCPGFHRGLISVVAPARLGVNTLPETSSRPCFGA